MENEDVVQFMQQAVIPYRKGDKWGYCTPEKKLLIECIYEGASQFENEIAAVKLNDKFGFIDTSGRMVIPHI